MNTLTERAGQFALASALSAYPDEELEATLPSVGPLLAGLPCALPFVQAMEVDGHLDHLRSLYLDQFDRGDSRVPLYETEYGHMRGLAKGRDLADLSGFYQAFGFTMADDGPREMLDHVAVELEFYAVLLAKEEALEARNDTEGCEIVADARKKFHEAHLGPFAHALTARTLSAAPYALVLAFARELVDRECEALSVKVTPLDFYADEEARSALDCGAVRLPVLQ